MLPPLGEGFWRNSSSSTWLFGHVERPLIWMVIHRPRPSGGVLRGRTTSSACVSSARRGQPRYRRILGQSRPLIGGQHDLHAAERLVGRGGISPSSRSLVEQALERRRFSLAARSTTRRRSRSGRTSSSCRPRPTSAPCRRPGSPRAGPRGVDHHAGSDPPRCRRPRRAGRECRWGPAPEVPVCGPVSVRTNSVSTSPEAVFNVTATVSGGRSCRGRGPSPGRRCGPARPHGAARAAAEAGAFPPRPRGLASRSSISGVLAPRREDLAGAGRQAGVVRTSSAWAGTRCRWPSGTPGRSRSSPRRRRAVRAAGCAAHIAERRLDRADEEGAVARAGQQLDVLVVLPPRVVTTTGMAAPPRATDRFGSCSLSVSTRPGMAMVRSCGLPTATSVSTRPRGSLSFSSPSSRRPARGRCAA